ncbi:hypothetical protein HNQ07_003762 [Deinococcus metalli]|uniref:Uncharacterized protein n=1 Tax=Deinococcus metalli TaxID=1141878 RepID=A0A7W8NQV6_9DEIO|nr:hypothetical protein [Deinococcus metalli]MBB5378261.1 hypothetical protein [Deinococcus metalli]GHF57251.1 hypothetical protein GCM10017781_37000 [Deinococcus metalli]
MEVNWAALGLPSPRALRLSPDARSRLAHLTELRDIGSPADATRAAAEFASEPHFARDLLTARPWLPQDTPRRDALGMVLGSEWTGFLALLGEYGPWVYTGTVRDLQVLGDHYGALVTAARSAPESAVFHAAGQRPGSLLTRLEATDYRRPGGGPAPDLAALEAAFWAEAHVQAAARHAARRR